MGRVTKEANVQPDKKSIPQMDSRYGERREDRREERQERGERKEARGDMHID